MKPLTLKDVTHVMTWVNDSDVVKNLQHFTKIFTRADEVKWARAIIKSNKDFVFSFFTPDGKYVGQGGVHAISWENRLGRLSLIIKREQWGKGYAQAIVPLLLDHAFKKRKLHKVWLMVWATNQKNIHVYTKLGFKKEGILKDEYFWHGEYHDMIRMRMTIEEWNTAGNKKRRN